MTPQEAIKCLREWYKRDKTGDIDSDACVVAFYALEKQIPKSIKEVQVDEYYCPACGAENNCDQGVIEDKFCPNCGQALVRSSEDESIR